MQGFDNTAPPFWKMYIFQTETDGNLTMSRSLENTWAHIYRMFYNKKKYFKQHLLGMGFFPKINPLNLGITYWVPELRSSDVPNNV